jgi:hypothetical protein
MRRVTSIIVAFVAGLFIAANVAMFYELMKRDEVRTKSARARAPSVHMRPHAAWKRSRATWSQVRTLKELIKKQNHHIEVPVSPVLPTVPGSRQVRTSVQELQNQLDQVVYSHPNLKSLPATPSEVP